MRRSGFHRKPQDHKHTKEMVKVQGVYDCPRCGFTLHTGDIKYRSKDGIYVCSVCAIMERGKGKN